MRKMTSAERIYKFFTRKQTPSELITKMDLAAKCVISKDAHITSLPRS